MIQSGQKVVSLNVNLWALSATKIRNIQTQLLDKYSDSKTNMKDTYITDTGPIAEISIQTGAMEVTGLP